MHPEISARTKTAPADSVTERAISGSGVAHWPVRLNGGSVGGSRAVADAAAEIVPGLTGADHISPRDKWMYRYVESLPRSWDKFSFGGKENVPSLWGAINQYQGRTGVKCRTGF